METVATIDGNLRTILEAARDNGYILKVLADHGQHESGVESHKEDHATDMPEDIEVPFLWTNNDELKRILMRR
jgi:bisphosphoglycerate-independent phosphoglycerate mutase (AlkP superfamily)